MARKYMIKQCLLDIAVREAGRTRAKSKPSPRIKSS